MKMIMKRFAALVMGMSLCVFSLVACGSSSSSQTASSSVQASAASDSVQTQSTQSSESAQTTKRTAKDGAQMQTDDPTMPTRVAPENGTRINMHFGDTVISGVLNDSETAKALIAKLPMTQHVNRYSHDFCGVTEELPVGDEGEHFGWLNGDIDYATDAPYFTILFEDEDVSEQYGSQVNIGVITCPLAQIAALQGSYDVLIELA